MNLVHSFEIIANYQNLKLQYFSLDLFEGHQILTFGYQSEVKKYRGQEVLRHHFGPMNGHFQENRSIFRFWVVESF